MDQAFFEGVCPISVYPSGVSISDDKLRWVVAHETFHCITGLRKGVINYGSAAWYAEGLATYFANVVYPENNLEHMFMDAFHSNSVNEAIVDLDYDAFSFFQFLENRFDPAYIIDLHDGLPAQGSDSDQIAYLAGVPDMQDLFQDFGWAYLTGQIQDTGGGTLPEPAELLFNPADQFPIGEAREISLAAKAFVLQRFLLEFRSGYEYTITKEEGCAEGRNGWRGVSASSFEEIPEMQQIICDEDWQYQLLLTSASEGAQTQLDLDFTSEEEDRLDCCLIGNWEQQTSELSSNFETIMSGSGANLISLTGNLVTVMTEDHESIFYPRNYSGVVDFPDDDLPPVTFWVTGLNTSRYSVPEPGRLRVTNNSPSFVVTLITGSGTSSTALGPEAFLGGPMAEEGTFGYTCSETTLIASTEGLAPFSSSTFQRVSEVPMTPMPEDIAPPSGGEGGPPDITVGGSECLLLEVVDFLAAGDSTRWSLSNGLPDAVEISNISLNWSGENGSLVAVNLDTLPLWTGSEDFNLAVINEGWLGGAEGRSIGTGVVADLNALFSGDTVGVTDYILVVEFSNGCLLSDVR